MFNTLKKIAKYPRLTVDYPKDRANPGFVMGKPSIAASACTACGECIRRCPSAAIVPDKNTGKVGINLDVHILLSL
jgi:formate hydrogenlyase subunit 6/NADH:ubiquinone oxidoreductase subunit I